MLSLGAGLSLLVTVALVDRSIVAELTDRLPEESPSYFVLDVKRSESEAFHALVDREAPAARIREAPMLRGRLVKLGDRLAETVKAPPEVQWALNGDRGLTYSQGVPEGSTVVAGQWWPADYAGEPLVSFEAEIAKGLGLKIGDNVTVNVLGRNVTAKIANLREVKWESLALNFVLVFSPNTLVGAPHNLLVTVTLPKDVPLATEAKLAQEIGRAFPASTAIRVKDAIDAFNVIFNRVMMAVRAAGSVTLLAGALVLAGALGHGSAAPHPTGRDPQDARSHQPPHPAFTLGGVHGAGILNSVYCPPDRQSGGVDYRCPRDGCRLYLLAQGRCRGHARCHRAGGPIRRLWHLACPQGAASALSAD